jgi:hypothetical protein
MLDHFCFDTFKKMGFYGKDVKRSDYAAQAARVCEYFDFDEVYEYGRALRNESVEVTGTVVVGEFASTVDKKGEMHQGGGFHLDVVQSGFACPVCTCVQEGVLLVSGHNPTLSAGS